MSEFDKTLVFSLGTTECRRCKKSFGYNELKIAPVYCSVECEQIDNDYEEVGSMVKI